MTRTAASILLLVLAGPAWAQGTLSTDSPFVGPQSGPADAPAANTDYEVVGAMRLGDRTSVAILNRTTQKNFWINVGSEVEGFALLSRDDKTGDVVARFNGGTHTLKMRSSASGQGVTNQTYVPPPVLTTSTPQNTGIVPPHLQNRPQNQEEQEREARMLVSDLLDIGMQQRKAYEERQRRTANGGQGGPNGAVPQPPTPTPRVLTQ